MPAPQEMLAGAGAVCPLSGSSSIWQKNCFAESGLSGDAFTGDERCGLLQPLPGSHLDISVWESALAKIRASLEPIHGQHTLLAPILPHNPSPLSPSCLAGWHQPVVNPLKQAACLPDGLCRGLSHFALPCIKHERRLGLRQRDAPGAQALHQPLPARPALSAHPSASEGHMID